MRTIINRRFRYTFSNFTVALISINVILFAVSYLLFPKLTYALSLFPPAIYYKHAYWQFLTYMFTHGSMWHLGFNMLALFMFGSPIERILGTKEFVLFYFFTGILTGIVSYFIFLFRGEAVYLMGASGAVFALMMLFSVVLPRTRLWFFGVIPLRSTTLMLIYLLIEIIGMIWGNGSTAHSVHLLGVLFAILYIVIRMGINPITAWRSARSLDRNNPS